MVFSGKERFSSVLPQFSGKEMPKTRLVVAFKMQFTNHRGRSDFVYIMTCHSGWVE